MRLADDMNRLWLICLTAAAVATLAACDGTPAASTTQPSAPATATPAASPTQRSAPAAATPAGAADCPVTQPAEAGKAVPTGALFGQASAYGNDQLWVGGLGPGGVMRLSPQPGEPLGTKLGWYRIAQGRLTISGRRLDAQAQPLRATVPDGYGSAGFQSSGVTFSSEGCWEITGAVGGATLTFVTFVVKT